MHRHYDTIYLDWEEPAEPNGILIGYILKYQTCEHISAQLTIKWNSYLEVMNVAYLFFYLLHLILISCFTWDFTSYVVNVSAGEQLLVEELPPDITQFSLHRFDRYTRYKFSLAAQTQVGVGEAFTEDSPHFTTEGEN